MLELTRTARKSGWWHRHARELSPAAMDFISLEADANLIEIYEVIVVPGLLQTDAYARAVIQSIQPREPDRAVAIRMARQRILYEPDAPRVRIILGEAALRQVVGGRDVMRAQLGRILDVASLGNIEVQVIPFAAGAHPGFFGPFTSVEIGERGRLVVVMLETLDRMSYVEQPEEVHRYGEVFDQLCVSALPEVESCALIDRIRSEL